MSTSTEDSQVTDRSFASYVRPILLFGDSLTQRGNDPGGWVNLLSSRFQRRADIVNRGLSGYNTANALHTVSWVLGSPALCSTSHPPLFATLFFGANDAADAKLNPKQHVSQADYKVNLAKLLSTMRTALGADVPIVVISPGALNELQMLDFFVRSRETDPEKAAAMGIELVDRTNVVNEQYAALAKAVVDEAADSNVVLLDLYAAMHVVPESERNELLIDGLHFTPKGNQFLFDKLIQVLESKWPDTLTVSPCKFSGSFGNSGTRSAVKPFGPYWDQIDNTDMNKSFGI